MSNASNTNSQGYKTERKNPGFRKKFSTIQEGINELVQLVPKIKSLVFDSVETDPSVQELSDTQFTKATLNAVLDKFEKSFPSIENEDYPNTYSLTIRGDMFFFRTKDRVSVSWEYDYAKLDAGEPAIDIAVIFNEPRNRFLLKKFNEQADALVNGGWEKFEYPNVKRRGVFKRTDTRTKVYGEGQETNKVEDSATFTKNGEPISGEEFKDSIEDVNEVVTQDGAVTTESFDENIQQVEDQTQE